MKKFLAPLLLVALGLASCTATPTSSSSSSSSEEPSSSSVVSSSEESSSSEASSSAEHIDYAHNGSVVLGLDYTGRSFWTDGVEKVTLKTCIDGDTAHFTTGDGTTLKSRFYGIDTPESTGKIQEWGKPASNYTKEKLEKAGKSGTIVVSSAQQDYGTPNPDSTGSRYVSLIWINETKKDAPLSELYLLNLMIVQDGYSWVKGLTEMPEYAPTFFAAEAQAKAEKLHLFGDEPDPLFNYGDYQDASLLEIKHEIIAAKDDPTHVNAFDGMKVRVQGTVAGYSNNILYIVDYFPALDADGNEIPGQGEYGGINIFTGMSSIPSKFTTKGNYIQVAGTTLDSENFGFQMSGCTFNTIAVSENDAKVIIKAADNTEEHAFHAFELSAAEINTMINTNDYSALFCYTVVTTNVTVTRGYTSEDGDVSLYFGSNKFSVYLSSIYSPEAGTYWNNHEYFIDHVFSIKGILMFRKTASGNYSWQIMPTSNSDITLVE